MNWPVVILAVAAYALGLGMGLYWGAAITWVAQRKTR